ncbi:glycosyltransferase [Haloprofundus sp. MHR1]|uniref:glycosyltransferase n=1 Tax=Haloprofundus sp. MHR1 TaxID=2572921 RepID=UPI0010BF5936|nr:glycosyltransferase [Haloprofundus sp. MHR1]QCJ45908.1 glycosyltransferase family 4 protein [Haloprofundus sp. MHR1]
MRNILTINRHTPYLYLLSRADVNLYVVNRWEEETRPIPENVKMIDKIDEELIKRMDAVISHQLSDLWPLLPKSAIHRTKLIQVIHGNRKHPGSDQNYMRQKAKSGLAHALRPLVKQDKFDVVFISKFVAETWPFEGTTIRHGIPTEQFPEWSGAKQSGVVVANHLERPHFRTNALKYLLEKTSIKIVGKNPSIEEASPEGWTTLLQTYKSHRYYLNLTKPPENSYNLGLLEAMAAGLPIITWEHPNQIIQDGVEGFVVANAEEAYTRIEQLRNNRELASSLGQNAKRFVEEEYDIKRFTVHWEQLIDAV